MTMLTHEEARRYVQAAIDKRLSAQERKVLEIHLAECPECRAYTAEMEALQFTLIRTLRARWDRRRAPVNLVKRAQIRARQYHTRKQVIRFATVVTQLSSFVAMAALVAVLLENQTLTLTRNSTPTSPASSPVTRVERAVPEFELGDADSGAALAANDSASEVWESPVMANGRLLPQ
jgi:anti-sigma factor RsiW